MSENAQPVTGVIRQDAFGFLEVYDTSEEAMNAEKTELMFQYNTVKNDVESLLDSLRIDCS